MQIDLAGSAVVMVTRNTDRRWRQCWVADRVVEVRRVPADHLPFFLHRHYRQRRDKAVVIMAGKTLADRYKMTRALGDGTFGEVLLGQRLDNGERVAVKRFLFAR